MKQVAGATRRMFERSGERYRSMHHAQCLVGKRASSSSSSSSSSSAAISSRRRLRTFDIEGEMGAQMRHSLYIQHVGNQT